MKQRMISMLAVLCVIFACMIPVRAEIHVGNYNDLYYLVRENEVVITGYNKLHFTREIEIPSEIDGRPVTEIEEDAFFGLGSLRKVTLPESLVRIGDSAFEGCETLRIINIPESLETIGNQAFHGCHYLRKVCLPESMTSIGAEAFSYCWSLEEINIPESITTIEKGTFHTCNDLMKIDLPESLLRIEEGAFYECSTLTEVRLPESVTYIGPTAFFGCTALEKINIPGSMTTIYSSFMNCTSLKEIKIPESVTKIGTVAFSGCTSLEKVSIPESVVSIGNSAFGGCTSLKEVKIPESLVSLGVNVFPPKCNVIGMPQEGIPAIGPAEPVQEEKESDLKQKQLQAGDVLEEIRTLMQEARDTYLPGLHESEFEDDGAIYYMNGRDGTAFEWFVNEELPPFTMFYNDEKNMGAIKLILHTNGEATLLVWGKSGERLIKTINTSIDAPAEAIENLALLLYYTMDEQDIWNDSIDMVDLDYKITLEDVNAYYNQLEEMEEIIELTDMAQKYAIVSKEITENGWNVGYMLREETSREDENWGFSGWFFLAGFESDAYLCDSDSFELMPIGEIYQLDPAILQYVCEPEDSILIRTSPDEFEEDGYGVDIYIEKREEVEIIKEL